MDNDLRELYQQVILDHNKNPRNYRLLENFTHEAEGDNPLCGDHIDVYVQLEGEVIKDITFQGKGCAISQASASLMTGELKGKTVKEAEQIFEQFHELVTDKNVEPDFDELGKLAVFAGVRSFPLRVKCASLAWHTMKSAVHGGEEKATTE